MKRQVVTISASYGAGGSVIGPRVAQALDVPFLDRAIAVEVSTRLSVALEDALAHDDHSPTGIGRLLASFTWLPLPATPTPGATVLSEHEFKQATERVIEAHAHDGAVILGRAGALVLAEQPAVLHVRLDGPRERRIAQAARLGGLAEQEARRRQHDADRARASYVKHLYHAEPADPRHYHLVLDSTAFGFDACVEMIVAAARARAAATGHLETVR